MEFPRPHRVSTEVIHQINPHLSQIPLYIEMIAGLLVYIEYVNAKAIPYIKNVTLTKFCHWLH